MGANQGVFGKMFASKQMRHMPASADDGPKDESTPSPLMLLLKSEMDLEEKLLDIEQNFDNPKPRISAKQITRRMARPVRVRGYNDSLFEASDVRLRRQSELESTTVPRAATPPADGAAYGASNVGEGLADGGVGAGSFSVGEWGDVRNIQGPRRVRPLMVDSGMMTNIDDNDI